MQIRKERFHGPWLSLYYIVDLGASYSMMWCILPQVTSLCGSKCLSRLLCGSWITTKEPGLVELRNTEPPVSLFCLSSFQVCRLGTFGWFQEILENAPSRLPNWFGVKKQLEMKWYVKYHVYTWEQLKTSWTNVFPHRTIQNFYCVLIGNFETMRFRLLVGEWLGGNNNVDS